MEGNACDERIHGIAHRRADKGKVVGREHGTQESKPVVPAMRTLESLFAEQGMDEVSISLAYPCPPFQDDPIHPALVIQNGQLAGDPCGSHPFVNLRNVRWQLNAGEGHEVMLPCRNSGGGDGSPGDAVHLRSFPLLYRFMDHLGCCRTALDRSA